MALIGFGGVANALSALFGGCARLSTLGGLKPFKISPSHAGDCESLRNSNSYVAFGETPDPVARVIIQEG